MIEKLVPETLPPAYSTWMSDLLATYYRAPNHPFKLRLATWLEKILGNKNIMIKTKRGFRFAANRFDYIQNTIFQTRDWEPEIGSILVQELTQNDVFFDIGANTGYFSCIALSCNVKQVIAFEPYSSLQKLFILNMEANHFSPERWLLQPIALSDQTTKLYYQAGPICNSGLGKLSEDPNAKYDCIVAVSSLDNLVDQKVVPIPTILKLDIEGWEIKVLNGSKKLFLRHPPRLVIFEAFCNSDGEILDKDLLSFFISYGYSVRHIPRESGLILKSENYVAVNPDGGT